ncbi:MAG: hypothetical protein EZS28_050469 [Streblomastix strix]|uniref:Uncharacterized protein n=1 Tax=Streblomastix strix TaxID=222440 RepID=A0A5J4T6K6_9EUKA|nr:MAG: hypothetical protein EZS28_050469 [Streblomastix strix]
MRLKVRYNSRQCLRQIQIYGDEQDQTVLVKIGYGRVLSISFSTAGGVGEEQDAEIIIWLYYIYNFLRSLHRAISYRKTSFQPLSLLVRRTEEQMEEEGSNEEIEAQMENKGDNGHIKKEANEAKTVILNHFIHRD